MKNNRAIYLTFMAIVTYFSINQGYGQNKHIKVKRNELYLKIAYLDSCVFATAYTCNSALNQKYFTENLEFYHDKAGLLYNSRQAFLKSNENKFCGEQNGFKLRRELVSGSMTVYPLSDYGAVQTGVHRFYQTSNGEKEKLVEIGKFTMIWVFKNNEWQISRVISYDHKELKEPTLKKKK